MVDFQEIGESFEKGFEKTKDFVKDNKILVICGLGVVGFALYKYFTSNTSEVSDETTTYAYVPMGYEGYPTAPESVDYDSVVEQLRNETVSTNDDFYSKVITDIEKIIDDNNKKVDDMIYDSEKKLSNLVDNVEDKTYKFDETMSYIEEQRKKQEQQAKTEEQIIKQMMANSNAWYDASESERQRLANENLILGTSIGAYRDDASGQWFKDGETLYTVTQKNKSNTSTGDLTKVGLTTTTTTSKPSTSNTGNINNSADASKVISQMKANSNAWNSASESERQALAQKNQELGKSIGATFDSATGVWSNAQGNRLY